MKGLTLMLVLLLSACSKQDHHAHEVSAIVAAANAPNANGGVSSDRWLDGPAAVRAEGFEQTFEVLPREKAMTKFPCIECHNKPLEVLRVTGKKDKKASHWDIRVKHGKQEMLACNTCHSYEDFALLKTLAGKPVALNHAYQVCGQCHSKQLSDWAGGAHGKRMGGWAPPRVVQNCAGCHNPHAPKLDSRWPALAAREGSGRE
jgi:hypothetical protein